MKMGDAFDNLDGLSKSRLVSIVSLLLIEIESARREDRDIADHLRDLCPDMPEAGYLLARLQWKERHQEVLTSLRSLSPWEGIAATIFTPCAPRERCAGRAATSIKFKACLKAMEAIQRRGATSAAPYGPKRIPCASIRLVHIAVRRVTR